MRIGVVIAGAKDGETVHIADASRVFTATYRAGQSIVFGADMATPELSGRHGQPRGYGLKVPVVGDAIVFETDSLGQLTRWGYLRHYLEAVERCHETQFSTQLVV